MQWLEQQPRVVLGHLPTPLEPLDRLSEALGGPRIWLKRDDTTGLATGGNKTRKLEYLLAGAANSASPPVVLTFGAVQSNHARQTAAACARLGLDCHLLLTRSVRSSHPGYETGGNILLGRLCGAHVHLVAPEDAVATKRDLVKSLEAQGRQVQVIPMGGSDAIGALGYVRCAVELSDQCSQLNVAPLGIMHASSSAGTQAGLVYGMARLAATGRAHCSVHGVNVSHADPAALEAAVHTILSEMQARYGSIAAPKVQVEQAQYLPGYGKPSDECIAAIRLAASTEGVLFDPVYSGKALAAVVAHARSGVWSSNSDVVLLHSGGQAALAVYDDLLSSAP